MIHGQDVYNAISPLEYFAADEKCSPFALRLPIGLVLSGPLPSSSVLVSACLKANMEQDFELASQVKSWYDMESYEALKQVELRSAADARVLDSLEKTTVHNGRRYDVGMLWVEDNIEQLFPSAGSNKIFGKAAYERPDFNGKIFEYHQRGLRQGLRCKGQRCS